jgi:hypothetical protein
MLQVGFRPTIPVFKQLEGIAHLGLLGPVIGITGNYFDNFLCHHSAL